MEEKRTGVSSLQTKYHEVLVKTLNNIGIIGTILACIADIICTIIFVVGVEVNIDIKSAVIFAVVNALTGILINNLLRYQGQKYAELENDELCSKFYKKRVKEKKYLSFGVWNLIQTIKDFIFKGCTTAFSIFGVVYLTIIGSHNPVQILIAIITLILFVCFGLMGMNKTYYRFYNVQVPYMEKEVYSNGSI